MQIQSFGVFFMAKYDTAFKLRAVKRYLDGAGGLRTVACQRGVRHSQLQRWVLVYKEHGVSGLEKKRSTYSAEFKLSVLQCMWDERLSFQQTCARFDLREVDSVARWQRQYHKGGIHALEPRSKGRRPSTTTMPATAITPSDQSAQDDTRTREELLRELEYLRAENAYLKKLDALLKEKEQGKHRTEQKKKRK